MESNRDPSAVCLAGLLHNSAHSTSVCHTEAMLCELFGHSLIHIKISSRNVEFFPFILLFKPNLLNKSIKLIELHLFRLHLVFIVYGLHTVMEIRFEECVAIFRVCCYPNFLLRSNMIKLCSKFSQQYFSIFCTSKTEK